MSTPRWNPTQDPHAPRPHPQYTAEELDKRVDEFWDMIKTNPGCKKFIFFHGDLSPGNVFVEAKGSGSKARLSEIIDFEFAGFYPSWYSLVNFRNRDYGIETQNPWEYSIGLCHYVSQHLDDFSEELEWRKARSATDHGYAKIRGALTVAYKGYKELQKQKDKTKEVAGKFNDEKPWWEWEWE